MSTEGVSVNFHAREETEVVLKHIGETWYLQIGTGQSGVTVFLPSLEWLDRVVEYLAVESGEAKRTASNVAQLH